MPERSTPLVRPIPRRPALFHLSSPTPPPEAPETSSIPRFLQTFNNDPDTPRTPSSPMLKTSGSSFFNLQKVNMSLSLGLPTTALGNTSTLGGIFSPSLTEVDKFFEEPGTPGTPGAAGVDDATYEVIRKRSRLRYQAGTALGVDDSGLIETESPEQTSESHWFTSLSLPIRVTVLFTLGAAYGNVLSSVHKAPTNPTSWFYLAFWGVVGVILGITLPWFDSTWDELFGEDVPVSKEPAGVATKEVDPLKEWTNAMRSVAAFVGIIFAIRRLPWDSSLQATLSLALVNPFLWYIIDRSTPGLLLSTILGTVGPALLMSINPSILPAPMSPESIAVNCSLSVGNFDGEDMLAFLTRGSHGFEWAERGVWMGSVLFCCAVCLGNVGRRMVGVL